MQHPHTGDDAHERPPAATASVNKVENGQAVCSWHECALSALWLVVRSTIWRLPVTRLMPLHPFLLRLFGATVPSRTNIQSSVRVRRPWDLKMGELCTLGARVRVDNLGPVEMGEQVVLSQDVYLCGSTHDPDREDCPLLPGRINIGSYAWIAAGAFIGPGVTIGEGAVVGARAVVMEDVEPWTIVAGNPASFVKKRGISSVLGEKRAGQD